MARPVTLFTGQWADLTLEALAAKTQTWGYDGLELACWGDHFDVGAALSDPGYCQGRHDLLARHDQKVWAISTHLVGQMVCDPNDFRTDDWAPKELRGQPEAKREWAIAELKRTAQAAKKLGVSTVCGFVGSPIWHLLYRFPNYPESAIDDGFRFFASKWGTILDEFLANGVRFALEVHPSEIAYDIVTAQRALEALDHHPAFGFNFDPSHLVWQGMDPVRFINEFPERIYHVHMKDASVTLDGYTSILASHLQFGDHRRGWDFRSLGHGDVDFEEIIRALNRIGYTGPLSVEWEDSGMDREFGASEACEFVRKVDFPSSAVAFDAAFEK
jgi:sugar phosphate isomerase/epimerase